MAAENRLPIRLQRFRQLPLLTRETWQGGIVRLPAWVEGGPDGAPYRPCGAVWVSLSTGHVTIKSEPGPNTHGPELLFDALLEFAHQERKVLNGRASRLQAPDRPTRDELDRMLGESSVNVEVVPRLDAVTEVLDTLIEREYGYNPPGILHGKDVTLDLVRSYAEAAALFFNAAPWRHLSTDDLIHVESKVPSSYLRHVVVLGGGGRTFGSPSTRARKTSRRWPPAPCPSTTRRTTMLARPG
jgi:hypothetical protein